MPLPHQQEWIFLILGEGGRPKIASLDPHQGIVVFKPSTTPYCASISPFFFSVPFSLAWISLALVSSKIVIASVEYRVWIEEVLGRSERKFLFRKVLWCHLLSIGITTSDNFSNWTWLEFCKRFYSVAYRLKHDSSKVDYKGRLVGISNLVVEMDSKLKLIK